MKIINGLGNLEIKADACIQPLKAPFLASTDLTIPEIHLFVYRDLLRYLKCSFLTCNVKCRERF